MILVRPRCLSALPVGPMEGGSAKSPGHARGCVVFVVVAKSLSSVARDHCFRREPIVQAKAEDIVAHPPAHVEGRIEPL